MSAFVLKIIGIIAMTLDHISITFFDGNNWMDYIGRLAFPIFAYLTAEGYAHTKDIKKYLLRLLITGLVAQVPFMLLTYKADYVSINTIFTLIFGLLSILVYDKVNKYIGILVVIILSIIAKILHFDHGAYGVVIIFIFYILRDRRIFKFIVYDMVTLVWYAYRMLKYNDYGSYTLVKVFKYYLPYIVFA